MIKHGARPTRIKHTDYDFLKSHRFGGTVIPTKFADEYFADAGLTMPNQDVSDEEYSPPTPPMSLGCTDFTDADLKTDIEKKIYSPNDVEAITHANALGGYDIRRSLDACTQPTTLNPNRLGWFKQYFNLRASGVFDYFDTFRIAQTLGINAGEARSISWGTPWFPSWEAAAQAGQFIMPMPTSDELATLRRDAFAYPWHNSKLSGWTTKNGVQVYCNKSWQGRGIGDQGVIGFTREVINMVMSFSGTVAFTATNIGMTNPQIIDVTVLRRILSILQGIIDRYILRT